MKNEKDYLYEVVNKYQMDVEMARRCLEEFGEMLSLGMSKFELLHAMRKPYIDKLQIILEMKNKKICDEFKIGQHVELISSNYEDLPEGAEGIVVDKQYDMFGCDLLVYFDGEEVWISAEDVI